MDYKRVIDTTVNADVLAQTIVLNARFYKINVSACP